VSEIEKRKALLKRWNELPPSARDHLTWEQFKRHEQAHQLVGQMMAAEKPKSKSLAYWKGGK